MIWNKTRLLLKRSGKITNKEIIISPIFYMGNKKKLIKKGLVDFFPKNIDCFIDVFSGSGIVAMNTPSRSYVLNDINSHLIELYSIFYLFKADSIVKHINKRIDEYGLPRERTRRIQFKDKEKIEQYKNAYMKFRNDVNKNPNSLDFYTLMFFSFSQQFRFNKNGEFNMPFGNDCFSEKNIEYIKNGCNFFQNNQCKTSNNDFKTLIYNIISITTDNNFYYFDPPYLNTTATYNENCEYDAWNEQSEQDLYECLDYLTSHNQKWALSNNLSKNKSLAKWLENKNYVIHTFDGFTYSACGKGNKADTKEVLITNY